MDVAPKTFDVRITNDVVSAHRYLTKMHTGTWFPDKNSKTHFLVVMHILVSHAVSCCIGNIVAATFSFRIFLLSFYCCCCSALVVALGQRGPHFVLY